MLVKDYMTTPVVGCNTQDGLFQTYQRMHERNIRHMPVLGPREELAGMVTDRDLRRPDWMDQDPNVAYPYILDNSVAVEQVMTVNPVTVQPHDDLEKALDIVLEKKFGALPVVDANHKPVGMVSTIDLLRAFKVSLSNR